MSSLVFNTTAGSAAPDAPPTLSIVPAAPTTLVVSTPPPSNTPVPQAAAIAAPIPIAAVVGATLGSVFLLLLVLAFILYQSRRARKISLQTIRDRQRRKSRRETWSRLGSLSEGHGIGMQPRPRRVPSPSLADPPALSPLSFQTTQKPSFVIASHPYSVPAPEDDASFYSTASPEPSSNPFADPEPEPEHSNTPFYASHPVTEKWGTVGKERAVAEHSTAPLSSLPNGRAVVHSAPPESSTMQSLIAALDLSGVSPAPSEDQSTPWPTSPSAFPMPPR